MILELVFLEIWAQSMENNLDYKEYSTSNNRKIRVYDNLVTYSDLIYYRTFCQNSIYRIGVTSSLVLEHKHRFETFFQSEFSEQDDENFKLLENLKPQIPWIFKNRKRNKSWINSSYTGSIYRIHTDISPNNNKFTSLGLEDCPSLSLLCLLNVKWDQEDGGETIFYNDFLEAEIAISQKPGRVIIFDSTIPHKPGFHLPNLNDPRSLYVVQLIPNE